MKAARILLRNLAHYRRTHIVVVAALALATAVMTGSLLVGRSVHSSVRGLLLARLGRIDAALVAPRFVRAALAESAMQAAELASRGVGIVPIITMRGAVQRADGAAVNVPRATVLGVDDRFWPLFPGASPLSLGPREAAVNAVLARALGVKAGDEILVGVGRETGARGDTPFAHTGRAQRLRTLRATVRAVLPAGGAGDYALELRPGAVANVYLDRGWLGGQAYVDAPGGANVLLATGGAAPEAASALAAALRRHIALDDQGLRLRTNAEQGYVALEADALLLNDRVAETAVACARRLGGRAARTSAYLATTVAMRGTVTKAEAQGEHHEGHEGHEEGVPNPPLRAFRALRGEQSPASAPGPGVLHYVTMAGMDAPDAVDVSALGENEVLLNDWAATALEAQPGDRIAVDVFAPDDADREIRREYIVRGVVALTGAAADSALMPALKGVTTSERMEDWDPPFAFHKEWVSGRDEAYWKAHRATPKVFMSLPAMRAVWSGDAATPRADWLTSVRLYPPDGVALDTWRASLERELLAALDPASAGLTFRPVREQALEAAQGTRDFGSLFASLSFFLVLSAVGLAAMTMRLSLLQRADQVGVMAVVGWPAKRIRRLLFAEAGLLIALGLAGGVLLSVGYARAVVYALDRWWAAALPGVAVRLDIEGTSMIAGAAITAIIAALALGWALRALQRRPALSLLAGWQTFELDSAPGAARVARVVAPACASLALALVAAATFVHVPPPQWAFMGAGVLLLVAGITGMSASLARRLQRSTPGAANDVMSINALALKNAALNRERSLLAFGLLASASFILVAVAVNKRSFASADTTDLQAGTGGFALRVTTGVPLPVAPDTPGHRARLGFSTQDEDLFRDATVFPLLGSGGDDVSCLNLAKPATPRLTGVSPAFIARGGFGLAGGRGAGWQALARKEPDGAIAVIGDAASIQWILHSGLGKTLVVPAAAGGDLRLRVVGLLADSIFQGELVVSEENLRRALAGREPRREFLLALPPGARAAVARRLREVLADWGVEVVDTRDILNTFISVQNTYLAMFLILGGLGLLLGTLGLVVVLFRNALERRREFAALTCMGFTRRDLARLLTRETDGLLVGGLLCGVASALVAFVPQWMSAESTVNGSALAAVLALVLLIGTLAARLAARAATAGSPLAALRGE